MIGLLIAAVLAGCSGHPDADRLVELKASNFDVSDQGERIAVLSALISCADDPDPEWRDGIGYEGVAAILRRDELLDAALRSLSESLLETLSQSEDDPAGVRKSFATLYLSEVIRRDRIKPFLTGDERREMVVFAADLLRSVRDYRGFDSQVGWRHQVAHTADLVLQLGLNPKLTAADRASLRDAILSQVSPPEHMYVYGEPRRLARAFVLPIGLIEGGEFETEGLFLSLAEPGAAGTWDQAYQRQATLVRIHNVRAFLNEVIVMLSTEDEDERLAQLRGEAHLTLRELP